MMKYENLSRSDKERFLMPILIKLLQNLGGETTRTELKEELRTSSSEIPEEIIDEIKISRKNGKPWKPFDFVFNFSISNLEFSGYLTCPQRGKLLLTEKGRECDTTVLDVDADILVPASIEWDRRSKKNKNRSVSEIQTQLSDDIEDEILDDPNDYSEEWKEKLKNSLFQMEPKKFEFFCRALVKKMGVDIDENIGVSATNDGGIDGFGYIVSDVLRTTRVAIQAKRWNEMQKVGSPEIDKFRGAMDKFRAEFGIFITTSRFSKSAIEASREGTRAITLIDGDKLIELIAKYQVYVTPITIYQLDDFYKN